MTNMKRKKSMITSIQYVHDPDAAQEWLELLMEITKKNFLEQVLNKNEKEESNL